MWRDARFLEMVGVELPIVQAPMAGSGSAELAIAVAEAGGLGSLPCAMLDAEGIRNEVAAFRARTGRPVNLNFFCHKTPAPDDMAEAAWRERLAAYYAEFGVDPTRADQGPSRAPFNADTCALVEELAPEIVSFHFGLPEQELLARVRATGASVMASATTADEARWLAERGCDAIIAQGAEAGGHSGHFLDLDIAGRIGTLSLVPQIVDAVELPVVAAGGIADGRGMAAALVLGAAAVQVGTAYLFTPEADTKEAHRRALARAGGQETALTNVFTGRPARGIVNRLVREVGPMAAEAPAFPGAAPAVGPLRAAAEKQGSGEFSPLWAGQSVALGKEGESAVDLTRRLAEEAKERLAEFAG